MGGSFSSGSPTSRWWPLVSTLSASRRGTSAYYMLTTICRTLRVDFASYSLKILIGRLRGSPGIVNESWGRRCWGKMVCLWKGTEKEKATAHKPAPPYGARRWSLHAPYASQLHAFLHAGRTRRLSAPGAVSAHLFNSRRPYIYLCAALCLGRRRTGVSPACSRTPIRRPTSTMLCSQTGDRVPLCGAFSNVTARAPPYLDLNFSFYKKHALGRL